MPAGSTLIMHQGIEGSNAGDYIQDKSAIKPEDVAGFQVISGHYHAAQQIVLPNKGLWMYTGNPYTLTWAEANDPEKGYHVLYADGTLEFFPTNLRKHVIWEYKDGEKIVSSAICSKDDLLWIKVYDTKENLIKYNKQFFSQVTHNMDFKLTLIPTDSELKSPEIKESLSQTDILDAIIDSAKVSDEQKTRVKELWRNNA